MQETPERRLRERMRVSAIGALAAARLRRSDETVIGHRAAVALLVLLGVALAGAGALLSQQIRQRELDRLADHLDVALQSAMSEAGREAAQAQQQASALAASRALQRALRTHDHAALERLTAAVPGATVVPAGAAPAASSTPSLRREVRVLSGGVLLGTVSVSVPIDGGLLARLRTTAPLRPGEGLLFARGRRLLAAPPRLAGSRLPPSADSIRLAGREYRVAQTPLLQGPASVRLAALAPSSEIDGAVRRADRLLVLGLVATLATLLLLGLLLARPVLAPLGALVRAARSSVTDELTQLPNRRAFVAAATNELGRARRSRRPLAVALVDIDDFKRVNDTFGHAAGDRVLRVVASVLREQLREIDVPARYGGEEFAILLPETTEEGGREAAERFRAALAGRAIGDGRSLPRRVTASVGVASAVETTLDDLLAAADRALYRAKRSGKDRVEVADLRKAAPEP